MPPYSVPPEPSGAVTAASRRCVVALFAHFCHGIGDSNRISDCVQYRQVRNIVTDICASRGRDAEHVNDFAERSDFVLAPLDNVRDTEFRHAAFDSARLPPADDSDIDAGIDQLANPEAILRVERFGFDAVI